MDIDQYEKVERLGAGTSGIVTLYRRKGTQDCIVQKDIPFNVVDDTQRKQVRFFWPYLSLATPQPSQLPPPHHRD